MKNAASFLKKQFFNAVLENDLSTVKQSLTAGVHIDEKFNEHSTAIMLAIFDGHKEIVAELLKHNPDLFIEDDIGLTPVFMADFCTLGMGRSSISMKIKNEIRTMVQLKAEADQSAVADRLEQQKKQSQNLAAWRAKNSKKIPLKRRR